MSNTDKRKAFVLEEFFTKFGSIKPPQCFWCNRQVDEFGIDFYNPRDEIVATAKCHGDEIEFRQSFHELMKNNIIIMRSAFQPGQGSRNNGKLQSAICQVGKTDAEIESDLQFEVNGDLEEGVKSAH